jgi:pantetheine-phosphate adenylyltransferase|tara:strand:- start:59 stop:520 length:462 start_codon:yes stop_codon:yes gene_type:complete
MEFNLVALGGTFDIIHAGHLALLERGFSISKKVIIGLTSDEFASKNNKNLINDFSKRRSKLEFEIQEKFPTSEFEISKLDNDFGPAAIEGIIEALVVSDETQSKGKLLNQLRKEKNLSPIQVIIVPMILAKDGDRISSSRIRNSEIDVEGNIR